MLCMTFNDLQCCIASVSSQMEERLRYWNGYLLFYERMEEVRTPVSAKKSKVTMWKTPSDKTRQAAVDVMNLYNMDLIRFKCVLDFMICSLF